MWRWMTSGSQNPRDLGHVSPAAPQVGISQSATCLLKLADITGAYPSLSDFVVVRKGVQLEAWVIGFFHASSLARRDPLGLDVEQIGDNPASNLHCNLLCNAGGWLAH